MQPDSYRLVVDYITKHQDQFYRLAYSYLHHRDNAMDVVQNAVIKALEKYESLRNPEYLKTWFYRVLVNECHAYLRKNKNIIEFRDDLAERSYEQNFAEESDLFNRVNALAPKFRIIIILRFYEELSLEEIAQVTATNLSTVKTRLYTALKKLKISMEGDEYVTV